jgi:esterase
MTSYIEQFNYQVHGQPHPRKLVFLHGLMGYGNNWRKIVSQLSGRCQILTFDQRGHGDSIKPQTGYAPEDYADDLALILRDLGWNKISLIGHSMGARNALVFSHKFSDYLDFVVLEDLGPSSRPEALAYFSGLFKTIPTPFPDKITAKEWFLNKFPKTMYAVHQPQILGAYFYSNLREAENGSMDWRFSKDAILESVIQGRAREHWQEFEGIQIPCLIIRGEDSKDLTAEELNEMLRRNPRAIGHTIQGAGHWVHSDKPLEFAEVISNFLKI